MKKYWVAHCRGCDYSQLKKLGFVVLHPFIDDYVFLKVSNKNKKYLLKENQLYILFIKIINNYAIINQEELDILLNSTVNKIEMGSKIKIIDGVYANLEGEAVEISDKNILCYLKGFKRSYTVNIKKEYIVLSEE